MKRQTLLVSSCSLLLWGTACQRVDGVKQKWQEINTPPEKEQVSFEEDLAPIDWSVVNTDFWYTRNPRVESYRQHYMQTRDPWAIFERAQAYLPFIRNTFKKYGLPNELCLLPMVESSFSPLARSERAAGLWQFVPGTATDMGLTVNNFTDERLEWEQSTEAAAKYLAHLAQRFQGDWGLVLASYNMGQNAIARAVESQGTDDYWSLDIREETTNYVPKFLAKLSLLRETYPDY